MTLTKKSENHNNISSPLSKKSNKSLYNNNKKKKSSNYNNNYNNNYNRSLKHINKFKNLKIIFKEMMNINKLKKFNHKLSTMIHPKATKIKIIILILLIPIILTIISQ